MWVAVGVTHHDETLPQNDYVCSACEKNIEGCRHREGCGMSCVLTWEWQSIIKSPLSGVILCFQFVSTAAAMTFASHVKTVCARP